MPRGGSSALHGVKPNLKKKKKKKNQVFHLKSALFIAVQMYTSDHKTIFKS